MLECLSVLLSFDLSLGGVVGECVSWPLLLEDLRSGVVGGDLSLLVLSVSGVASKSTDDVLPSRFSGRCPVVRRRRGGGDGGGVVNRTSFLGVRSDANAS